MKVAAVTTRLSLPPAKPCIPSCKNITGSSPATCDNGLCKCTNPSYTYFEGQSLEGLLGRSSEDVSTQRRSGCYVEETPISEAAISLGGGGGKSAPVGAIVGGLIGGLALLSLIGVAIALYVRSHRPKSYFIQPNDCGGGGGGDPALHRNFFSKKWAVKREEVKNEDDGHIQTAAAIPSVPSPAEELGSIAGT